MDRRHFIKVTAGTTAGAVVGTQLAGAGFSAALGVTESHFQYGVASGDPLPNGAVIWTRVTPNEEATPGSGKGPAVPVRYIVATDPDLRHVVKWGRVRAHAGRDHTVKVDVRGLRPGTQYYFGFRYRNARSPVGRFRTTPPYGARNEHLRFGLVSCSNYAHGFFSPYRHLADRDDLDFVLHVGDYIYEYEDGGYGDFRPLDPATETITLNDYRRRFAIYRADPDLAAVHAMHPFITTIDDHEITNDAWAGGAENHDDSEGDYQKRRRVAMKTYSEWMPVRVSRQRDRNFRVYRGLRYGRLADLSVLDLRQYRSQPVEDFADGTDPARTMLGDRQEEWFLRRLGKVNPAQWRLIANSVQMMQVRYPAGFAPDGEGTFRNLDAWDGYRSSRDAVLDAVEEGGADWDAVFLTGDIHSSWASDLKRNFDDPNSSSVATEFVTTSVTSDNLNEIIGAPPRNENSIAFEQGVLALNPHIDLLEFDSHGYTVIDVNPDRLESRWYYVSDREDPLATSRLGFTRHTTFGSKTVSKDAGPS